jgi:uncharacterized protein GlcG (DUF336 family)
MKHLCHLPLPRATAILKLTLIALLGLVPFGRSDAAASLPQQPYLPLKLALQAASAALAQCQADGYQVSVAVMDRGGVLKVLLKDDGAGPHTVSSSAKKAYTAASLGRATRELAKTVATNPEVQGLRDMDAQILLLAGGLPISLTNTIIGGIGVGGAPSGNFDEKCAQRGLDSLRKASQ